MRIEEIRVLDQKFKPRFHALQSIICKSKTIIELHMEWPFERIRTFSNSWGSKNYLCLMTTAIYEVFARGSSKELKNDDRWSGYDFWLGPNLPLLREIFKHHSWISFGQLSLARFLRFLSTNRWSLRCYKINATRSFQNDRRLMEFFGFWFLRVLEESWEFDEFDLIFLEWFFLLGLEWD